MLESRDQITLCEIDPELQGELVATFLSSHSWPFHGRSVLTMAEAREVQLGPSHQVRAFWIKESDEAVGIIRAFDLEDAEDGSVAFDVRISPDRRGRGIGRTSIRKLVDLLFAEYPQLHRIEATTRFDNHAMRRVLETNGFMLEGRLRETWPGADGIRFDTAIYGRLRSDA